MNLLTPSSLRFVLNISVLSRIVVIATQFICNIIIEDHNADAYRNRYHLLLRSRNTTSAASILPQSYQYADLFINGLSRWDSQYFLEISKDGYVSEQHLAFLPSFPIVISLTRQIIFEHGRLNLYHLIPSSSRYLLQKPDTDISVQELEVYTQNSLVGVALNNFVFFPIACLFLYMLTKLVKSNDEKYARTVVWLFCINPASVFFSACYSEAAYAALTFCALLIIELRAENYITKPIQIRVSNKDEGFKILSQLNRLLYTIFPALAPLALAASCRSNGLVNIGFVGYQLLLKYAPLLMDKHPLLWTPINCICLVLEFVQDILVFIMASVFIASGYISFQIYSYVKFCTQVNKSDATKHILRQHQRPEWCDKQLPHPYGQVQAKFWNVGLFKYYELKQLPNFILAAPVTYIIMKGCLAESKILSRTRDKRLLVYYMHAVLLTLICSISINIQVVTRLIASSCPALYWICADMMKTSRTKSKLIRSYFLTYFILGVALHPNFYPWT